MKQLTRFLFPIVFSITTIIPSLNATLVESETTSDTQQSDWRGIVEQLHDAVVQVKAYNAERSVFEPYNPLEQSTCSGTAFFINDAGYLLTNFHVVDEASIGVTIQISSLGKEEFDVEIVTCDPECDLAVLRLAEDELEKVRRELGGAIPFVELGDSDEAKKTQGVLSLGYPLTDEGMKISRGDISGKERINNRHYLQISAPLNSGNSGGPVVGDDGRVVGIATRARSGAQNIGYAIPVNDAKVLLASALTSDAPIISRHPDWGISRYANTSDELLEYLSCTCKRGIYLIEILPGSLLERADVRSGDVLCAVDGLELDRYGYTRVGWCSDDKVLFGDVLNRKIPGDVLTLSIDRNGERLEKEILVEGRSPIAIDQIHPAFEQLDYEAFGGMVVMELTENHIDIILEGYVRFITQHGFASPPPMEIIKRLPSGARREGCLIVTKVFPNSLADKADLGSFSVIEKVNGRSVRTLAELRNEISTSTERGLLRIDTEFGTPVVLRLSDIAKHEDRLVAMYGYRRSSLFS